LNLGIREIEDSAELIRCRFICLDPKERNLPAMPLAGKPEGRLYDDQPV